MENENFDEYMTFFKEQNLKEKQNIILEQLKMLAGYTNNMCKSLNIPNNVLVNKELLDLNNEEYTQDDVAEAIITYLNSIQNSLNDFNIGLDNITDSLVGIEN